ncbi:MAG: zinc-dependent peptidase [Cyclobacteriaceae bacterium]
MNFGVLASVVSGLVLAVWFYRISTGIMTFFNWSTQYKLLHWWHQKLLRKPLRPEYKYVLTSYFGYYNRLRKEDKLLFERRVQYFIDTKKFISRSSTLPLSNEMIVLISACAIQLTFGFPGIYFRHFYRILIYPDDYYSRITRKYHQGEVNRAGIIVLSWKNFLQGYAEKGDGRNLGLHEMAHAMLLENQITNNEYEFLSKTHLNHWYGLAENEMDKIRSGNSIFRKYGASNIHEFFAVAVEVYFEQPRELLSSHPDLYYSLASLLNQDVLEVQQMKKGDPNRATR